MVDTPRGPASSMTVLPNAGIRVTGSYGSAKGIVMGTGADWMGPLDPLAPVTPTEVAGRAFDFEAGYNLNTQPRAYTNVTFQNLKALADGYDLLRLVIETRKDEISRLRWKFKAKTDDDPKTIDKTTPEQQTRIDEVTEFFKRPDGYTKWRAWLRAILEQKFVYDAVSIYKQRNRGGRMIALKQIDGALIKPIIDDWGRTPIPYPLNGKMFYPPAFQQILKGMPGPIYTVKDMLYLPYNKRIDSPYGYSEVEQILVTVNIALRRQAFQMSYYTEGNVPEALIGTPDTWTPDQINAFQRSWDSQFTGNLAQRRRAKFVPGGIAKTFIPTKEPDLKNPMDEWLARILCFAFSVSPQALVSMMNRATGETADQQAKEGGSEPLKEWICEMLTDIVAEEWGYDDIEFAFDEETAVDPVVQQKVVTGYVDSGILTVNRGLEMIGEEKSDDPAADVLMIKTGTGRVPIDANTVDGKKAAIAAGIVPDPTAVPEVVPGQPPKPGAKAPQAGKGPPAAKPGAKAPAPAPKGSAAPQKSAGAPYEHADGSADPHLRFRKAAGRAAGPVPFDFGPLPKIERRVKKALAKALKAVGKAVAAQVRKADIVEKARKTPSDIADAADLSAIDEIILDLADEFGDAAEAVTLEALATIGVDKAADLVDVVNERAVRKARDIAGELVGMRFDADGNLVEAARAEYRIDQSTRNMINEIITKGLDDNVGSAAIADNIESSTAFSAARAALIAATEIARVVSMASLESYLEARDELGVDVKKEWLLAPDACPICEANNDQGAIDLDDDFDSGDPAPPAHPNCRCSVSPVVGARKMLKYVPPEDRDGARAQAAAE